MSAANDADLLQMSRRSMLYAGTAAVGAAGLVAAAWPFIDQLNPDAATRAAGDVIDVDLAGLQPARPRPSPTAHRAWAQPADRHRPANRSRHRGTARREAGRPPARCEVGKAPAAGLCGQLAPLDRSRRLGADRRLHLLRLQAAILRRAAVLRRRARRLRLPLLRRALRPGRAAVHGTGAVQSSGAAL